MFSKSMPGEILLLFTLAIWFLFFMIYMGNRKNKLNQWCFFSGMCFSIGVFKEYLYHFFFPFLMENWPGLLNQETALTLYSILTAIPYYFAMPISLILGYYYCHVDQKYPRFFPWLCALTFLPALILGIRYPFTQTRYYQLNDSFYYGLISFYNLLSGCVLTFFMVRTLIKERFQSYFRQKLLIAVLVLTPLWFTLMTVLPVQLLRLENLTKLWQLNFVIVFLIIGFYFYHAFRGGILGNRLKHEAYDWDSESRAINKNIQFIRHTVKNELIKIEWCTSHLNETLENEEKQYTNMILSSCSYLREYLNKISKYSEEIQPEPEEYLLMDLIASPAKNIRHLFSKIQIRFDFPKDVKVFCDKIQTEEVLSNLFFNAAEAMEFSGVIQVSCAQNSHKNELSITIRDQGYGFSPEQKNLLFSPYYTTKTMDNHMGLGLYYCKNVMTKHGGRITASSNPKTGTAFTLVFPSGDNSGKKKLHGK